LSKNKPQQLSLSLEFVLQFLIGKRWGIQMRSNNGVVRASFDGARVNDH
jgi:hypothetical protein